MLRLVFAVLLAFCLSLQGGDASAEEAAPSSENPQARDEKAPPATFGDSSYPLRFARRPLVLDEGMVRADSRVTVGGVIGPGTFSALDLGGAVSPIDNLELGLSTELTGAIPAAGGISLVGVIFSPKASYGDIPIYARYQFVDRDQAMIAVDLTLVLPTNTDFSMTASLPLRIVELFDLFTMDMNVAITYRNGDKYAALSPNPSKNTADFSFSGGSVINITDKGFIEIGGGLRIANVGGGADVKTVIELPAYLGGGYTLEKKVLVDLFAQFGWDPLMTANTPPGRDTFNIADDWFVTIGATVHTRALFGKNVK